MKGVVNDGVNDHRLSATLLILRGALRSDPRRL